MWEDSARRREIPAVFARGISGFAEKNTGKIYEKYREKKRTVSFGDGSGRKYIVQKYRSGGNRG